MPARRVAAPRSASAQQDLDKLLVELTPDLYSRALHLARCRDVAEDLVQDTIERSLRFRASLRSNINLRGWVFQILFGVFISRCRKRRHERAVLEALATTPWAWPGVRPFDEIQPTRLPPKIARVMNKLPDTFRDVLVACVMDEMSYKNASERLGVPVGTVMSRLNRGRGVMAEAVTHLNKRQRFSEAVAA